MALQRFCRASHGFHRHSRPLIIAAALFRPWNAQHPSSGFILNSSINNHNPSLPSSPHSSSSIHDSENFYWKLFQHPPFSFSFSKLGHLSVRQSFQFSSLANTEKTKNEHKSTWVDLYLPQRVRPYAHLARLHNSIGTWLLVWPCMWSITLAASPGSMPDMKMIVLFGCGALLLRGAGCTVNDLLDRDIDVKVQRTMLRPIASGVVTPFQGLCFLGFQLLLGLGILLQLNTFSRVLGASSLLLVFSYPLMKRLTFWPQAFLGLTFNWGALLGWAAIKDSLDPAVVLPLYLSGVFWTLVYDTIYAHQYVVTFLGLLSVGNIICNNEAVRRWATIGYGDKEDDIRVGVKSTALRFGDSTKEWIAGFGLACTSSLALSGYNADIGWPYYAFLLAATSQLAWQIKTVDLSSRVDCNRNLASVQSEILGLQCPVPYFQLCFNTRLCLINQYNIINKHHAPRFVSNKWFGALIFSGILFGRVLV